LNIFNAEQSVGMMLKSL